MMIKCLVLCLCAFAFAQLTPPVDSSCRVDECAAPEPDCNTPEDCATSGTGCGCKCAGCPSCRQNSNPPFNKQCSANLVMILDESGSIQPYTADVQGAVVSFLSSFSQINNIGGTATLGLVEFSSAARLPNPSGATCQGVMCTLNSNWVTAVTGYINSNAGGVTGYTPGGCTNWGEALRLAFQTGWKAGSSTGTATPPDVILFFTDGNPTVHTGTCNTNCNQNRDRIATFGMKVGQCNGNHVGTACFWADQIKAAGIKLFTVGIGGAASHVPNVQLVAGPILWDQSVGTFGSSDYVLNAQYSALGAIFYNVAKGLCGCLQDITPCADLAGQPTCVTQQNFDARAVITTSATTTNFPPNGVYETFFYFDFKGNPSVYAMEFVSGTNVQRTDIINPCNVARSVGCPTTGSCSQIADKAFILRLFVASGDAQQAVAGGLLPKNAACSGGTSFRKTLAANQPSQIEWVWMTGGVLCAARSQDGTLYEFFKDTAKAQPGVNYRKPQQLRLASANLFDFKQLSGCSTPICTSDVELLFVIDQQFNATDYFLTMSYVKSIVGTFDDNNNRIKVGAYFKSPSNRIPSSGWQTQLVVFGNQVLATPAPAAGFQIDFLTTVTAAINSFWPAAPNAGDPPRYLLTIVGGPDQHGTWTATEVNNLRTLRANLGIESWAVGVAAGSSQLTLLQNLADSTPYSHFQVVGTASTLVAQFPDQASRMCPKADLCGGNCQGLCICGVCQCPTCNALADKCVATTCASPNIGCVNVDKRFQFAPNGCVPTTPNPCTHYDCNAATGQCTNSTPCGATCGCTNVPNCQINTVAGCTSCTLAPVACGNDLCGSVCNPATNTCGGAVTCNDNNGCTSDRCVVKVVGGVQQAVCEYTDNTQTLCPAPNPCVVTNCSSTGPSTFTCTAFNLTSLIDLCGVCLGDFASCFFSSITPVNTGGLAAGVIAGIVAAGVAAAALIAYFSKRGYDAYMARSAMGAPTLHENALFKDTSTTAYTHF